MKKIRAARAHGCSVISDALLDLFLRVKFAAKRRIFFGERGRCRGDAGEMANPAKSAGEMVGEFGSICNTGSVVTNIFKIRYARPFSGMLYISELRKDINMR